MHDKLKLAFKKSLIGSLHPLYVTPFNLSVWLENINLFLIQKICPVLLSYHTYDFPESHPHGNSMLFFLCICFRHYYLYFTCLISVKLTSLGDPTDRIGNFLSQLLHMFIYYDSWSFILPVYTSWIEKVSDQNLLSMYKKLNIC